MVPGSTLMYGSSLMLVTRMLRDSRIAAREAAAMPFPSEETTPPVTKTYFAIYLRRVGMEQFTRKKRSRRDEEIAGGLGAHFLDRHARVELLQHQPFGRYYFEHAQIRDDHVDHALAGDRQRAALKHLRGAVLRGVLHQHHDPADARDQVHRAAGALDHLPRHHPVGEVAVLRHLQAAEDGKVDVPAADHGEGVGAGEEARAGDRRDGLLAGVDEIRIDLALGRERADAEQAVLRLQGDVDAGRDVVGDERRDADPQIDVEAVAQLLRRALRHQLADRRILLAGRPGEGAELDALLELRALDDAVDVDARRVDLVGIELAHLDQLLDLGHRDLAAGGDHRVEVARGLAVDEVARLVALPCLDHGEVGLDALLQHVFLAVEGLGLLALGELGAGRGARIEARDAGAAGAQFLGEGSLRRELQVELAREHLALELLVLADVRGDDLLHLPGLEQQAHAEVVHAGVVADDG